MIEITLTRKKDGTWWHNSAPLCSVKEASQELKKSRRQIYRYIESEHLKPVIRVFGEVLLNFNDVKNLKFSPFFIQPLPAMLTSLFPEYDLSQLNAGRFRNLIISRVLEWGNVKQLKWLLKRYTKKDIMNAIDKEGKRLLNERSLILWTHYFNMSIRHSWRIKKGTPWDR